MPIATEMKMNAIAPWFGGKRTLAPVIVEELGKHRAYWEPFCGSMAVLLAKEPCSQETVCDLHEDLTNLAWVLADPVKAVELYERLNQVIFTEAIFEYAREVLQQKGPSFGSADRAYWYFIFSWMGRNGLAGTSRALTSAMAIRYTSGGGSPTIRFRSAKESIPPWHYRLQNALILRRDAFEVLPEIEDKEGTVIYIDSPYLFETRSSGAKFDQGAKYLHDFDEPARDEPAGNLFGGTKKKDKHDLLAEALFRYKHSRVVISYYDHPRLRDLYAGWTFRSLDANKNMAAQNRRDMAGRTEAPEILIINGPSFVETA